MPSIYEASLRHARYYLQALTRANLDFIRGGDGTEQSLRRFDQDRAQTDAAWNWLIAQASPITDQLLIGFGEASMQLGLLRYHPARDHLPKLQAALAAARRSAAPLQISALSAGLGQLHTLFGDIKTAHEHSQEAVDLSRAHADRDTLARALLALSICYFYQGEFDLAQTYLEESLALDLDDQRHQAGVLRRLGIIAYTRGQYETARIRCEQSRDLFAAVQDKTGVGAALVTLGNVAYQEGDRERAVRLHQEALAIHREIGSKRLIAISLQCLGFIAISGNDPAGRALHQEAYELSVELGDKQNQAVGLYTLATAAFRDGDLAAAASAIQQSLAIREELGDASGKASSLIMQALLELLGDNAAAAHIAGSQSLALAEEIGKQPAIIESRNVLSSAHLKLGQHDLAQHHAEQALRQAYAITNQNLIHWSLVSYVRVRLENAPEVAALLMPHLLQLDEQYYQRVDLYNRRVMDEIRERYAALAPEPAPAATPAAPLEAILTELGVLAEPASH